MAILVPGFPRLKEWAYAGIFFDLTGAVASHAACGDVLWHIVAPAILAVLAVVSWSLRPPSRVVGTLFVAKGGQAVPFEEAGGRGDPHLAGSSE